MYSFRATKEQLKEIKKLVREIKKITGQKISSIIIKSLETYKKFI